MRIVFVSDWYSEDMGYLENCLPREIARKGAEVHVVASNAQVYFNSPGYDSIYSDFLGPRFVTCGRNELDGITLHRLPLIRLRDRLGIKGLSTTLRDLKPDIVQALDHSSLSAQQCAIFKAQRLSRTKFFSANHVLPSVFPPPNLVAKPLWRARLAAFTWVPGRLVSLMIEKCYAATTDAAEVAITYLGVQPRKVTVSPLGVDTHTFHPPRAAEELEAREKMRAELQVLPDEVLCLYSGRFSEAKNPLCLANAIGLLRQKGHGFRALFIGSGPQAERIAKAPGCVILPFMPHRNLGAAFRAADAAVWPRQESTSMLDAGASGLPVIVSSRVRAGDRLGEGVLTYEEDSAQDLVQVLATLIDPTRRRRLGEAASARISATVAWAHLAEQRTSDYRAALADR